MTTVKLYGGDLGPEIMFVRCNLVEASAPIQVDYHNDDETEWLPTQYQCADARHCTSGLIGIGKQLAAQAVEMPADEFKCKAEAIS